LINCLHQTVSEKRVTYKPVEKALYRTWLFQQFSQKYLETADGTALSILDPGQRNLGAGPDFQNARILIGDEIQSGAVEIHVSNSDWYQHKHHLDEAYNNVILHVVLDLSNSEEILTQAGRSVPIFRISPGPDSAPAIRLCEDWNTLTKSGLQQVLQRFSEIRFQRKGKQIRSGLLKVDAEQFFYCQFLDVLGYSRNRESFGKLAALLPLNKIFTILQAVESENRIVVLESILLGVAGFLEAPNNKYLTNQIQYYRGILQHWEFLKQSGKLSSMRLDWHFAGIRPWNFPHRRIIALTQILAKFYPDNPAQLLINQIGLSRSFQAFLQWVREYFQQPGGMWKNHPFLKNHPGNVLIGSGRLMDVITNLLLPFAWAIASQESNATLAASVREYIDHVPRGEIPSAIKKWAERLKLPLKFFRYNYLIQGAIELNHCFCDLDLCKLCPLEEYAG
jgi:hypothetical protein